jgi:hypothetical protein
MRDPAPWRRLHAARWLPALLLAAPLALVAAEVVLLRRNLAPRPGRWSRANMLAALETLPFLAALPWALRELQVSFDEELDRRLAGAARSAQAALDDLGVQVERAVRDLATDPAVEDIAHSLDREGFERAGLVLTKTINAHLEQLGELRAGPRALVLAGVLAATTLPVLADGSQPTILTLRITRDRLCTGLISPYQCGQFIEYLCGLTPSMFAVRP